MTDIVERLRVKWDSMGDMANAERDEAAYAIICLRNECAMEVAHTKEIRQQVADLRALLAEAQSKVSMALESSRLSEDEVRRLRSRCEMEASHIAELKDQISSLRAGLAIALDQRDEARREVCAWQSGWSGKLFKDTAAVRGWDCFPEAT